MHSLLSICIDYLQFYKRSFPASGHGIHSPFVYAFCREVMRDTTLFPDYVRWQAWHDQLRGDQEPLPMVALGAPSATARSRSFRTVSDLAMRVAKPPRTGRLLYRLARHHRPEYILELGTSLGLSTAWFSLACPSSTIHTIEGNAAVAHRASSHFKEWGLHNIRVINENFDDCLPSVVAALPRVDLAFLDGNHRQEPTLRYFEQLLAKKHAESVFVVDDIYWSREMKAAWQAIRQHPEVRCTIDLFQFGLVFFKSEFKEPRHFSIRF